MTLCEHVAEGALPPQTTLVVVLRVCMMQRSALCALGAVASARAELAEAVVAGGALPAALLHAGHDAMPVRRAAACLVRDIVKHSVDVSALLL